MTATKFVMRIQDAEILKAEFLGGNDDATKTVPYTEYEHSAESLKKIADLVYLAYNSPVINVRGVRREAPIYDTADKDTLVMTIPSTVTIDRTKHDGKPIKTKVNPLA